MSLIKLPNETWVNPAYIISVGKFECVDSSCRKTGVIKTRVKVHQDMASHLIDLTGDYVDEIVSLANSQ